MNVRLRGTRSRIVWFRLVWLLAAVSTAMPVAAGNERPRVPELRTADELTGACAQGLHRARALIAAMAAKRGGGTIFAEWNRLDIAIEDAVNPIYLLGEVHPDKAVRDVAEPCLQQFTALSTEIFQNEKLYARVRAVRPASATQAKLRKDLLEAFEDSGVALAPERRRRAKEIFDRLEELRQVYDRNVRDDPTKVVFSASEMEGLPESYLRARERDGEGRYVLGLDYPSYVPFMANARDESARSRYYRAKLSEGGAQNLALLEEIFRLRRELAQLYDLPSFAHYALRRRMVGTPETVLRFLGEVKTAVSQLELQEIDELRSEKARETGRALDATRLERWDVAYYQEQVRRSRFAVNQEELRRYFPTARAVEFVLRLSEMLYGIRFEEHKIRAWHDDVRYFDMRDARSGRFIAGVYLDLFPRDGKYRHAAAFPVRGVSRLAGRTPLSVLVTNFNREGLDHEELQTLLHEFGHVLHGVLSRADYSLHAGTSVRRDFVEAPSQMFEEWGRREQPLALMKKVCAQCPQLTAEEIDRLDAARRYGQGIRYARQWLYAAFDMELSTQPQPPLALWKRMESATPLGHVEGTVFPASFSHIASGYAAGYYGYMWSEVLALDMLSKFKANMLSAAVGRRYRDTILAQGGQVDPMRLVRRFLGRDPSSDAFFAEITGRR